MQRLRRVERALRPTAAATAGDDDATVAVETDALTDDADAAAALTPWSERVRELLAERCPQSWAQNEAGFPLLGIDPGERRHPRDPAPMLYARAEGQKMWDIDGNEYVDYNNAFGPHLLGYNHPEVVAAVQAELANGMHYNFPYTRDKQSELAELLVSASPAIEQVVFFNSGSDATAMAIRAARAHTGKTKLGIFDGAYHGTHDWAQVAAAPGSELERPSPVFTSDGIPDIVLEGVCLLPYNSSAAFDRIREQQDDLAVVMIQAVQASNPRMGMGPWLRELAQVCRECDVLLAFDETVTGFRMAWGGGHVYYDVTPDLVTYGKVIGGGMPIGCVGGRAAIMRRFGTALNGLFPLAEGAAPAADEAIAARGKAEEVGVFGAIGTFNGFPLALASGIATLSILKRRKEEVYPWLEATNTRIAAAVNAECAAQGYDAQVVFGGGAYLQLIFQRSDITCAADVRNGAREAMLTTELKLHLLSQGINVIKTFLLTLEHTEADIDHLIKAMIEALRRLREDGLL